MKRGLIFVLLIGVAFLFSGCAVINLEQANSEYELAFPADLPVQPVLVVDGLNGNVNLTRSDTPGISVQEVALGSDPVAVKAVLDDVNVSVSVEDSIITIRVNGPENLPSGVSSIGANLDIATSWQIGDVNIVTRNGNIQVEDFVGFLEATTTNGTINVANSKGVLNLDATNGNIVAKGCSGVDLGIELTNGNIVVNAADNIERVLIRATNADIDFSSPKMVAENDYRMQTSNGDIDLTLPQEAGLSVTATTTNGQIYCEYDGFWDDAGYYDEEVNGGGAILILETENGDINIEI